MQNKLPKGALKGKVYKVLELKDESGAKLDHDIKEIGNYEAKINLHPQVQTQLKISVQPDSWM